jgi:anti-anti-sigma factor
VYKEGVMEVRVERLGPAVVLDLEGRLTIDEDTGRLHELARSSARSGSVDIVLDLGGVRQIDCSGIGQLMSVRDEVRAWGGSLALVNLAQRQRRLLQLFGLLAVLRVFESRAQVVAAAVGRRAAPADCPFCACGAA